MVHTGHFNRFHFSFVFLLSAFLFYIIFLNPVWGGSLPASPWNAIAM